MLCSGLKGKVAGAVTGIRGLRLCLFLWAKDGTLQDVFFACPACRSVYGCGWFSTYYHVDYLLSHQVFTPAMDAQNWTSIGRHDDDEIL
ncbi:jg22650 [Pararge aegeria aegeria]|uniref:Jg22650 protein n=1 Tax=Pararge aegeria aegeria TaxID=348720 RepID=A0A8S4RAX4_9NEOP|nr:jg22650 [Pararge aegeria aegeria]